MILTNIKDTLLDLDKDEKEERFKALGDYLFYQGKCRDLEEIKSSLIGSSKEEQEILLGQSWLGKSDVDYQETQEIRNKIKPLLKKRARFMFGCEPTISIKVDNLKQDREKGERLRKFLEDVLDSKFWNLTKKAYLDCSIKKRVLLRAEYKKGIPIKFKYESIENFSYKMQDDEIIEVKFFEEDKGNVLKDNDREKIYYIHEYTYQDIVNKDKEIVGRTVIYQKKTYQGDNLDEPKEVETIDTLTDKIPCWLIKNSGELNSEFGESDVTDIRDAQNAYNRKVSDFNDALKFGMFGSITATDCDPEDVDNWVVAPGSVLAAKTAEDKEGVSAKIGIVEHNLSCADAVEKYLDRAEKDMKETLDIPDIDDLSNIPSAKAMKYMYNDLIIACEDKWNDWTPVFLEVVDLIMSLGKTCYPQFDNDWTTMAYTLEFKHNYPLPEDEGDKKDTAIKEVDAKVRSRQSYIRKYSDEEDAEEEFNQIIEENKRIAESEDTFNSSLNTNLNNIDE